MSLEKLALEPRKPLELGFDLPDGRLHRGERIIWRASFLDQTEKPTEARPTLNAAVRSFVTEAAKGLLAEIPQQPFDKVALDEAGQTYLDIISMLPTYQLRDFGLRVTQAGREITDKVKRKWINSLENEQRFPGAFYLDRLVFLGMYLPTVINSVLEGKPFNLLQEDNTTYSVKRALAGMLTTHVLKKATDADVRALMKAKLKDGDKHPYLNAAANEFVITGLDPDSAAALRHGLSHVLSDKGNPYNLTPAAYAAIAAIRETFRPLFNGKHEDIFANPENIDKIFGNKDDGIPADPEAKRQIAAAVKDMPALFNSMEALAIAREARKKVAQGYDRGLVGMLSDVRVVEAKLAKDRKALYAELRFNEMERKIADAAATEARQGALEVAVRGYSKLLTNAAVQRDIRKITDKSIELLVPDGEKLSIIENEFKNGTLYVFSEKGPILAKRSDADASSQTPGAAVQSANPIFAFIDIRGFTDLIAKYGAKSAGTYVAQFYRDISKIIVANEGRIVNRPGDALVAMFDGKNAAARYMNATANIHSRVRVFNEEARQKNDLPLSIGIGADTGEYVSWDSLPTAIGDDKGTLYVGSPLNLASRLTTTAHPDLAKLLERLEHIQVEGGQVIRKPESHILSAFVLPDGKYHNKSNLMTEAVVEALKKEGFVLRRKPIYMTDEEMLQVNHYFEPDEKNPSEGRNVDIPDFIEHFDADIFHDPIADKPRILWRHRNKAVLKGFSEPVAVYELMPATFLGYKRLVTTQ